MSMMFQKDRIRRKYVWSSFVLLSTLLFSPHSFAAEVGRSAAYVSHEVSEVSQQKVAIRGRIVDEEGLPIVGANVVDKTSKISTLTDESGQFELAVSHYPATIIVSYLGYDTQKITLKKPRMVKLVMRANTKALGEVVVVGFGKQKKANLTGAVSAVKMDDVLGDRPITNVASALQGAVPGLRVGSGGNAPGAGKSFQIRGAFSIGSNSVIRPLVLIDNVEGDLSLLNPEDIESVSVMKDAASSAIYGARAAGGVILVTTKHPKDAAKFHLNYNNNFSFTRAVNLPKQAGMMDYLRGYLEANEDAYWTLGNPSVTRWMELLEQYRKDPGSLSTFGDGIYMENGAAYFLHEHDLVKDMLETGFQQKHNISASGGMNKLKYRFSGGYVKNDGVLSGEKDNYKRLNVSSFVSAKITDWFRQEATLSYATSTRLMPNSAAGGIYTKRLVSYYPSGVMPEEVNQAGAGLPFNTPRNLLDLAQQSSYKVDNPRIFLKSVLTPLKDLEMVFEYTFDGHFSDYAYYTGLTAFTTVQGGRDVAPSDDFLEKKKTNTRYNAVNMYATYHRALGEHDFRLMGGFNQESKKYDGVKVQSFGQAVVEVPALGSGTSKIKATDFYSNYALRGGFFRFNYNFANRYLLEVNGRYDGSSKFPESDRFGFFPSVSVGWNLANEHFMAGSRQWLGALKLRGSYGKIGNQNISPYAFIPTMSINNKYNGWVVNDDYVTAITNVPDLVSNSFTWEKVNTLDVGVDWSLWSNRLSGSFDWYVKDTKGMLAPGMELPAVVGAAAPLQNTADMRTKGWDLSLQWRDRRGEVGYSVGFNISDYTSKITKYNDNESKLLGHYYEGMKLGEIWGYEYVRYYGVDDFVDTKTWVLKEGVTKIDGTNPRPGDCMWKNLRDDDHGENLISNGDNTVGNPGDRKIIGNSMPRYLCGVNLGVSYKGWGLSVLMQGTLKRDAWLNNALVFPYYSDHKFMPLFEGTTDYWRAVDMENNDFTAVNAQAKFPRIYGNYGNMGSNYRVSDRYLQNAAYWRIQTVTLSYVLPERWTQGLKMSSAKLFVNVENLATFSSLPKGLDPETLSWNYPANRAVSLGVNLTL